MDESFSLESLQEKYLISSLDDLVNILKAVSQPSRLQILIHSLNKPVSFKDLLEYTNIQKTALNVHLNQLIEQQLLLKEERGIYRTTILGEELIRVSALVLKDAHIRKVLEEGRINIKGYERYGEVNMSKLISEEVVYQPAWLSYLGSVTGVMKYHGLDVKLEDVAGYSGYSFLLNMAEAFTCPSGPTAHPEPIWEEVHNSISPLGATITHWFDNESFPETEFAVSSRDQKRSKVLFEKVRSVLDVTGHPVVIWGIPIPEYGIVKGYEKNSYVVSTFRHLNNIPDSPIKYDALQAPGCLEMITIEPNDKKPTKESDYLALQKAQKFAMGNYKAHPGYKVGLEAIDVWIHHLEQEEEKYYPYHGNSYLAVCTEEAFHLSSTFLEKKSKSLNNPMLQQASIHYGTASVFFHLVLKEKCL